MATKKYSVLKGIWKGLRPAIIAVGTLIVANYQEVVPKEILTPAVVLAFEFIRNLIKQKSIIAVK